MSTTTATRTCPDCDGLGHFCAPSSPWIGEALRLETVRRFCGVCRGTGRIPEPEEPEREVRFAGCDLCEGLGREEAHKSCRACGGDGFVEVIS